MRAEEFYLRDILEASADIAEFIHGLAKEDFFSNKVVKAAVLQKLAVIGEASNNLSDAFKSKYANIDWSAVIGTRHILVHSYFKIDWDIVWDSASRDVPQLSSDLATALAVEYPEKSEGPENGNN